MKHLFFRLLSFALPGCMLILASCAKEQHNPTERTSNGLTMDGTHHISIEGAPDLVTKTGAIDSAVIPEGWSCPPLSLPNAAGFVIGSRNGRIAIYGPHDSLASMIVLQDHGAVDQLLADSSSLNVIEVSGVTSSFDFGGKEKWTVEGAGVLAAPAVLGGRSLLLPELHTIVALDSRTGKSRWDYPTTMDFCAASYSAASKCFAIGLSGAAPGQSDSILFFSTDGVRQTAMGFENIEITSNIAICGKDGRTVIFGGLNKAGDSPRAAQVFGYRADPSKPPQLLWKHTVPFLVGSIATNSTAVFASGFRTGESDVVSGITAFALSDTSTLWQRRFTEPLAAPIAASDGNIYFTLNFESEAIVTSRGLFYTLSATDGHTISERPLPGAEGGLFQAMPMPDDLGRFLVADRTKPIVYILDRSALRRMF